MPFKAGFRADAVRHISVRPALRWWFLTRAGAVQARYIAPPRWATLFRVLADFVCSVQPGAADGVAFDGGDHVIEGEAGWQAGGLGEGEELEGVGVGSV